MTKENLNSPEDKQYGGYEQEFMFNNYLSMIFNKLSGISPYIIFPILSLYFHNWWLLLGILFSIIGRVLSVKLIWILIALVLTITYSLIFGFVLDSYVNIFFLCYSYGHITSSLDRYFEQKLGITKIKMGKQANQMFDDYRKRKSGLQ